MERRRGILNRSTRPGDSFPSSFNMPFTTMNNYNWLFDLEQPSLMANIVPQARVDMSPDLATGNSTSNMPCGGHVAIRVTDILQRC